MIAAKGSRQHRLELVDLFALRICKTQDTDTSIDNMLSEIVAYKINSTESPALHGSERGTASGVIKNVQPATNSRKLAVRARKGNAATTTYLGIYTSWHQLILQHLTQPKVLTTVPSTGITTQHIMLKAIRGAAHLRWE